MHEGDRTKYYCCATPGSFTGMRCKFEALLLNPIRGFSVGRRDQCAKNPLRVIACELCFEFLSRHLWGLLVNELVWQLAAILTVVHKAFTPVSQKKTVLIPG